MPGYVHEAINRFKWDAPGIPQTQLYKRVILAYETKVQYAK